MKRVLAFALPIAAALAGCQTIDETPNERLGQATLRLANGLPGGTAQLLASGAQVNISIAVVGLAPGAHGVHLHMTGSCEAPDFVSAGGHLNPAGHQHGSSNPAGPHLGDLPNITVGSSGTGTVSATLPGTREEVLAQLFDGDGTAVVVHAECRRLSYRPVGQLGRADRLRGAYADLSIAGIARTATPRASKPIGTTASVAMTPLARLPVASEMKPAMNGPRARPSSVAPRK